jgi:light-regulated signal transduction histidine kinase (bacteriophytochrome)
MHSQAHTRPSPPWGAGPYSTKRHGTTIATCDSEPVRTPGCIQAHGVLLVLRLGDLQILQVSDNTEQHLGVSAAQLLGQSVALVVGMAGVARLQQLLISEAPGMGPSYAFTLPALTGAVALDACVHTSEGVAVLELEATGRDQTPADDNIFLQVRSAVARLHGAADVRSFCQRVTEEVRALTGLDRVMAYRFHADHHGEVIAESMRDGLPSWLGLHYPAADIPAQAREMYKALWIRPLPHAAGELVELLPLANPQTGHALNMTHCALRGASVMYTEYLANMGAAASLTMPLLRDGELWGLIACQHNTPTHFPYPLRAACELLAQVVSLQLQSAERAEVLAYRLKLEDVHQQLVARSARAGELPTLMDLQPSLLDAIASSGAALYHQDRWWCVGQVPALAQLNALADWLNQQDALNSSIRPVFTSDALASLYPAAADLQDSASGVLVVPLSRSRRELLIWFRPQTIQTIPWAGKPDDKPQKAGPYGMRLTPRGSFALFTETVKGRSLPWLDCEVDAALHLRQRVLEGVISRGERLEDLNTELSRSNEELDAFAYVASHDLKEPLRGVHHYAHQLLEGIQQSDADNRQRLEGLMRLTVRMDNLLDSLLNFSQLGRMGLELESVDFNVLLEEALESVGARRTASDCRITIARALPILRCDPLRVGQIYSNLLSNALKYRRGPQARIEVGYIAAHEVAVRPNAPAESAGLLLLYVKDEGIGIKPQHYGQVFQLFKRMHGRDDYGGGVGAGLTIVKKIVQRHGGQVWLDSTPGLGSTFYFTLPG